MPTEITPEQREALAKALFLRWGWFEADWSGPCADRSVIGLAREKAHVDVDTMIALGWRAPGPATEEEVERAARAGYAAEYPHHRWGLLPKGLKQGMREYARAALNAALNQEAGNG